MDPLNPEQLAARWTQDHRRVEAFIYSLLRDFHQTDDVVQNVAMVVVRKREEYDPTRPFLPWALQIAKLEVKKQLRTLARDRHSFQESLVDDLMAAHQENPLELAERRTAVVECVEQCSPRNREVLLLRFVEGLKPAEIAGRLKLGGSAARMLLLRARQAIRECVELKLGDGEERR